MSKRKKKAPVPTPLTPPATVAPAPLPLSRVSIEEARRLCRISGVLVHWRPEIYLPEAQQYCLTSAPPTP